MLIKRIQMTVFVLLLLGTTSLYYGTSVTVNARITTLESALAPEPFFEASTPKAKDDQEALELKNVHREVASLFDLSIPQAPEIPDALNQIALKARTAGIRGMSMSTHAHRSAEFSGAKLPLFLWPIDLRFQSEYAQLAQFVHALQGISRLTEVLKISMKRNPPGVAVELSLAVYSQTAPPLVKDKAKNKQDATVKEMGLDRYVAE